MNHTIVPTIESSVKNVRKSLLFTFRLMSAANLEAPAFQVVANVPPHTVNDLRASLCLENLTIWELVLKDLGVSRAYPHPLALDSDLLLAMHDTDEHEIVLRSLEHDMNFNNIPPPPES